MTFSLLSRYRPEVMGDGVRNQVNNPEVEVDVRRTNHVIQQQLSQLRIVTQRLRLAYDGLDVDYIDTTCEYKILVWIMGKTSPMSRPLSAIALVCEKS